MQLAALASLLLLCSSPATDEDALVLYSAGLDGLFVDARDAGLVDALRMLDDRLAELGRDFGADDVPEEGLRFAHDLLTRPLVLRAGPGTDGPLHLQLSVECADVGDGRRLSRGFIRLLRDAGIEPPEPGHSGPIPTPLGPLAFGLDEVGERFVFSMALGDQERETFRFHDTGLPTGVEPAFLLRYDGRIVGRMLAPFLGQSPDGDTIERLLSFFGLAGEGAMPFSWALGYSETEALSVRRCENYVAHGETTGMLVRETLDAADFRRLPADATLAALTQLPFSRLLGVLDAFEPGASPQLREAVKGFTSIDIQEELFEKLGPSAGFFGSRAGGGGLPSMNAFVECRDSEAVARTLERIQTVAMAMASSEAEGRVRVVHWTHENVRCNTLTFPGLPIPLEVSWAVAGDALWLSVNPHALRTAIDQASASDDLRAHPHMRRSGPRLTQELVSFSFYDAPFFLERGYGTATFIASAVNNVLRSPYDPQREPRPLLPALGELSRDAAPWLRWARIENGDLVERGSFQRSWVGSGTSLAGTSMTQLYGGVGALAMISSISIPKLFSARLSANESSAIATLRNVCSAQAQVQAMCAVDVDRDGAGEYGTFGELSGRTRLREGRGQLNPPVLSTAFGELMDDGQGGAVIARNGYYYQMWLPDARAQGVTERTDGAPTADIDPDKAEILWGCYAWPIEIGRTGKRAFFVDHTGDVRQFVNQRRTFGGLRSSGGTPPAFASVFDSPENWTIVR